MLSAIDSLLQHDFVPSRTVILSIGFDEEGGAERSYGARCLAQLLLDRYGENGIELIVRCLELVSTSTYSTVSLMKALLVSHSTSEQTLLCPERRKKATSM